MLISQIMFSVTARTVENLPCEEEVLPSIFLVCFSHCIRDLSQVHLQWAFRIQNCSGSVVSMGTYPREGVNVLNYVRSKYTIILGSFGTINNIRDPELV